MEIEGTKNGAGKLPVSASKEGRLRKACSDFEAIFVEYLLKTAREASSQDGLFNSTQESKIYRSLADQQMAQAVTRGRGLGLGDLLYQQLKDHAEETKKTP